MTIWEMSMPGGHLRLVLNGWKDDIGISSWTPDGSYTFLVSGQPGSHDMGIWARREDCNSLRWGCHEPVRIAKRFSGSASLLPSRDGKRLFVIGAESRRELARYDLNSATFVRCLPGILAGETDFSPDGQWVAYARIPESTLWRSRSDGSNAIPLTVPGAEVSSPHWSSDGKQIAYMAVIREGDHRTYKAYATPAAGGEPRQLVPGTTEEGVPTWSPDGQRLAFGDVLHIQNASAMAIHILELRSHRVSTLPGSNGLWSPRWSPNGRYIAALALGDPSQGGLAASPALLLYDFGANRWTTLAHRYPICDLAWSPDSHYIYFRTGLPDEKLYRVQTDSNRAELLTHIDDDPVTGEHWLGMAPDGSPLFIQGTGLQEIYAMDMDRP